MFINGDSELRDNNFVSSQSLGDHLFILAKEFYSFTNSIYIFQLPSDENDDNLELRGVATDTVSAVAEAVGKELFSVKLII